MEPRQYDVIVAGGGASGVFAAINLARLRPDLKIAVFEKTSKLLSKVKISGGGRCNVTNARTSSSELTPFYPRGGKKLYPIFKRFGTRQMVDWLSKRGVETKSEADLRMFPVTDNSQTIIDCFLKEADTCGVSIHKQMNITEICQEEHGWLVRVGGESYKAENLIMATGASEAAWKLLEAIHIKLVDRVPSLFTFQIKDPRIEGLPGVSFEDTDVRLVGSKLMTSGPMLITHWGLSGPSILKMSGVAARQLNASKYQFEILVNYLGARGVTAKTDLTEYRNTHPKQKVLKNPLWGFPKRFWEQICRIVGCDEEVTYESLGKKRSNRLIEELTQGRYQVTGKSTFKEEFVTAGGVDLSEVDLGTFASKKYEGLYLAGEVLDIDALTGGFNFQACWSGGWIIAESIANK